MRHFRRITEGTDDMRHKITDEERRDTFSRAVIDLTDILGCYDSEHHRIKATDYLDVYGIFKGDNHDDYQLRGRIMSVLRDEGFNV